MTATRPAAAPRLRVRRSAAITVAAFVAWMTVGPLSFALIAERPLWNWFSVLVGLALLAAPVAVSWWAWRSGVDVTGEAITIRGLRTERRIAWDRIDGFVTDSDGVAAILDDQSQVRLRPLRAENLRQVLDIGGQELRDDASEAEEDQ